jgi:hypothetical protein
MKYTWEGGGEGGGTAIALPPAVTLEVDRDRAARRRAEGLAHSLEPFRPGPRRSKPR